MNRNALRDTWIMFQREHGCSIDKMLCNPDLRNEFVAEARLVADSKDEYELLWGLVGLRKRNLLPRNVK